ncbi:MAG: hypothetical protein ACYC2I_08615 [Elusimicrobiales bacterium]
MWTVDGPSSGTWIYSPALLNTALQTAGDRVYNFRARAQDNALPAPNPEISTNNVVMSGNVIYDRTKPVSRVTFPLDGSRVRTLPAITGTAVDNLAGISTKGQVTVSIAEVSPAAGHWNGLYNATFTLTSETFQPLSEPSIGATYTGGNWSFTIDQAKLRDGYTYRIKVKAADDVSPPNVETDISSVTFTFDQTAPLANISYPASLPAAGGNLRNLTVVSGTAYEQFGVKSASISVQEADTLMYYDTQTSTFSSAANKWITAVLGGTGPNYTWSVVSPSFPPLLNGKNYNLQVKADDLAGNELTPPTPVVIRFDQTEPDSAPTSPVNGGFIRNLASVAGTAVDQVPNPSGAAGTQIRIQRLYDAAYWNGSTWASDTWLGAVAGSPWTKSDQLPQSNNTPGGLEDGRSYFVQTRAYDVAGNTEPVAGAGNTTFTFDVSSPTAFISTPLNGLRFNSLTQVSGTAADAFNVNFPQVRIYDMELFRYWMEGSGSCGATSLPGWVGTDCPSYPEIWNVAMDSSSVSGNFVWRYNSSAVQWPDLDAKLQVEARASDRAGNSATTSSVFSFDSTPPDSLTTYPPVNGTLYSSMTAISGTSLDMTSAVTFVYTKIWYLSAGSTYYWHPSGIHWTTSDPGWQPIGAAGGPKATMNPWTYSAGDFSTPGSVTFAWKESTHDGGNGKTFYIVTKAVDATTNEQLALSTRTFQFDNVPPVSAPVMPGVDTAYNALTGIWGTSSDAVTAVASVKVSILDESTTRYFDGSDFNNIQETWHSVTNLYPSSWTYTSALLPNVLDDKVHYVFKSSATDSIGNVQNTLGRSRFLYDVTQSSSAVLYPDNSAVKEDNTSLVGNFYDPGYTTGINGTGSGVYPSQPWHKGKVEVVVFRDTEPYMASEGPLVYGSGSGWDSSGYFWNGSTWAAVSAGPVWVQAQFDPSETTWLYEGLACDGPGLAPDFITGDAERAANTCWMRGDPYTSWVRVTDNAGVLQDALMQGPKFYIAAPPKSFLLTVGQDPMTAGAIVNLTVEAKDALSGAGNRAAAYIGTVTFHIDLPTDGPEVTGNSAAEAVDEIHGLPQEYKFVSGDYGYKTFQMRLRKRGSRTLSVADKGNASLNGAKAVTVNSAAAEKTQIIADFDPAGEMPAPGTATGKTGAPRSKPAGTGVPFLVQVTDKYWNVVLSSAVNFAVTDEDPNNGALSPDSSVPFVGSTTVNRIFVSADAAGWSMSAGGAVSSKVPVTPTTVDRLLALLPGETRVQGKYLTPSMEPLGKTGTPSDWLAGSTVAVVVYGVDQYYNTGTSAGFQVGAYINTDIYDVNPSSQNLVAGATTFVFTPVTAGTQTVMTQSDTLPAATSAYYTPTPVKVWWNSPAKLHLVVAGQSLRPGLPPYTSNPSTGGKIGTKSDLMAGNTTQMAVYLTDNYYNVVSGTTPFLAVSSNNPIVQIDFLNDANIQLRGMPPYPNPQRSLLNGTTTFSVVPVTRNQSVGLSVQVTDTGLANDSHFSTDTVTGIRVNPAAASSLLLLVPNETALEGAPGGKTGTAGPLVAGSSYTVSVRAVDVFGNLTTDGRIVRIQTNDQYVVHPPAQPMASGIATIANFVPSAATGNLVIDAIDSDSLDPKLSTATDSNIVVTPGTPSSLIVLLPTQYLVPGKTSYPFGAAGTISTQTAGVYFDATVYAADTRYNMVTSVNKNGLTVSSNDPFASAVGSFNMTGGSMTVSNVNLRTAGLRTLTASDSGGLGSTISGGFILNPNNPTRLRVLLPGESRVPGSTGNGRSGTPTAWKAGASSTVIVDITDSFWNLTPGASQEIRLIATDPFATVTPSSQVIVGSATFTVTPIRAGQTYLRAELVNAVPPWGPTLTADTGTVANVSPGDPTRLLLVLPDEDFNQGSATGKVGTPPAQTAGTNFPVRVGVVDSYFNLCPGRPADVRVNTPTDPYAPAVATAAVNTAFGYTGQIYLNLHKAATHYLSASDYSNGGSGSGLSVDPQSSTFTVRPALAKGLQLLMPGETAVPGSGDYPNGGKVPTASTQTAGAQFYVTVNLVDHYMNVSNSLTSGPTVYVVSSDIYDVDSSSVILNNGSLQIPMTLVTKANATSLKAYPRAEAANWVCPAGTGGACRNDDAAARASFKVYASTAVRFEVILPGQSLVEGKCDVPGICAAAGFTWPGRSGPPSDYTIGDTDAINATVVLSDRFYNRASEGTGTAQDTNPPAVMPKLQLTTPGDWKLAPEAPQVLVGGSAVFSVYPETSFSTYTLVAATTTDSAASYSAGVSTVVVNPGPADHLAYVLASTNVTAGTAFSALLYVRDVYENICSTGPNLYLGTATISVTDQVNPNQDPLVSSPTVSFVAADAGVKNLENWFTLRKAGLDYIGAFDQADPAINITPLVEVYVAPGPPSIYRVTPTQDVEVAAGSILEPGRQLLTAQLSDAYDNNISSADVPAIMTVAEVYGATGTLQYQSGGAWYNYGSSTTIYTDTLGQIGVSTPIAYKVSTVAGDYVRVWIGTTTINPYAYATYAAARQNLSGQLTTTGGTPSKLLFVSSVPAAIVGVKDVAGSGGAFTIERRDDFGNLTKQGQSIVYLTIPNAQITVHTALGRTLGTFGSSADYGFRNTSNEQFISAVSIAPNATQASFRYHDRTSSYSGLSPAQNTYEGGRPGYWRLQANSGSMQPAAHDLRMDPISVAQVAFGNPRRELIAGKIIDTLGDLQTFEAELRDMFSNPTLATAPVQVLMSTDTRQLSLINDSFSFSPSSAVAGGFPPKFESEASYLDIPLNGYAATFYYIDTTASTVYPSSSTPVRPIIRLSAPEREGWAASTQSVTVLPDFTYRINVSSGAGQTLTAGVTSQMFVLSVEDMYGNPTPVVSGQEDEGTTRILFTLDSNSAGGVQFASPNPDNFIAKPGTASISIGQDSARFYVIDTLASYPTHQLTVNTSLPKGWLPAVSSYTVVPAGPDHTVFITPQRRLVAGTTVQYANYATGLTTPTVITVALKDRFENTTTTSTVATVTFTAARTTTRGWIDPNEEVSSSNPLWKILKTNSVEVPIQAGKSLANIYVWDTLVGSATINAATSLTGVSIPTISQDQYITPSTAAFFTLHHNYSLAYPLRVLTPGTINLKARDRFGNVSTGDAVNGQYYTGKVKMATNSRGSADLRDWETNATFYTFVPADQGERALLLQDTMVETLKVSVTDYALSSLYGYTADSARAMPVQSSPDVILSGLVITPTDIAPEDPLPASKTSIGVSKYAIYQGDGAIDGVPAPVPMIRLTMQTSPVGAPPAFLKSVQVRSSGTLSPSDIVEINMYADNPTYGQLGAFDGETVLYGPSVDFKMSSGTYDTNSMTWNFEDLKTKVSTAAIVSNTPRNFFFAVRMSTVAATPRSFGLVMESPSFVVLESTFVGVAYNNFPIFTATSPVRNQPAVVQIKGSDIAAWWQPVVGTTTLTLAQYPYVEQGQGRVGFLRIQAWTDNFLGTIKSIKVLKTGTGAGADIKSVRLFMDSSGGDPYLGDCFTSTTTCDFQPTIDKEVTDPVNPPSYDPNDPGTFVLPFYNPGLDGSISVSTRTYFVVYEFGPDAIPNQTHGARVENAGITLIDGVVGAFQPVTSSTVPLYATSDIVYLTDVNKSQPNGFATPSFVTQNDVNKAMVRLTMQINGSQGSAVWRGLKLDRWITGAENGDTPAWNKVTDVKKISIWHDSTGDGLLQTTTTVKDTEVLLVGTKNRIFPYSTLKAPLVSTDTVIRVTDIQQFFPTDSPFPMAPGRLIINDAQDDPSLKEVVYYNSVDVLSNSFGNIQRAREGTSKVVWSSGTVISGQAVLPLIGEGSTLDGQVLYTTAKDYFVTYDIAPLANVSNFSYLGLAIRSTDYFYIETPKVMSTVNIGVTAPGKSVSLIGKVREFADNITVIATDTITGDTLQQQTVNQPILDFTMRADVADAMWRFLLVYATGTVIQEGSALNDVSAVKVWYDHDNNGFLGGTDVMIGSGTFGNTIYGPLVSRINLNSEQRIFTEYEASVSNMAQRYFITYDIRDSAMPNDSLGNPRYLGAYLKSESLPQGSPSVDDVARNALSLPNVFAAASSNFPYVSKVREIISSPSTITVLTDQVFSPAGSGSATAIRLAGSVDTTGPVDAYWVLTSTLGIPMYGYAMADNEIVKYDGIVGNALYNVTRGAFGSAATVHSSGTALGGMVQQGWTNYPFMKLTITTPGFGVRWQGLKLVRKQPPGLNGYDSDVAIIRVWKDNGNGVFDRDAASGLNTSDVVVGSGKFGVNDPVGKTTINVADPALNNQNYVVVSATPTIVFVSMDIDRTSNFSHEQLNPPNDVLGIDIPFETNFIFGPENSGHNAYLLNQALSLMNVVMPTVNTITMTPEDISPVNVTQHDKNVGILSMRMVTDKTSARVQAIKMLRRGTCNDSDIDLIKVWEDSNDNCLLDSVDTASDTAGAYPHLMSYGNESYSSSTVNVVLKREIIVTTNAACSFVSYDMSQFALVGSSAAVVISSAPSFTIGIPNSIALSTWPIATMPMIVKEIPSAVLLGGNDMAADLVQAGGVGQAQLKVPMARINLVTEAGNARWSAIKLQRTGASNDPNAPFGKNNDVKFLTIYQDSNQNDTLDVNDLNISEVKTMSLSHFASTDTLPFQLVVQSTAGLPAAGRLYLSEAELVTYSGIGVSTATGKAWLTVISRGEKLGDFNTPMVTHPARSVVRKVDLYDQENALNTQITVQLSQAQTLSPLPQTFFVAYDIGEMAMKANKVGVMIRDKSWITVNTPHDVAGTVYVGITKALPRGTYTDIYPFSSSLVPIKAITLTAEGINISPKSAEKGSKNVPLMTLNLTTLSDYVAIGQINFTQIGTVSSGTVGFGDGDLSAISLWKDDGDGAFSPITDYRLGTTAHSAGQPFEPFVPVTIMDGNLPYLVVATATVRLHLSCDISSGTDLTGADVMGHVAGISLESFTDLRGFAGLTLAAGQYYADSYPMKSNEVLISPAIIPLTPVYSSLMIASNGYPAYALLDSSGNVVLGSGNIPVADTGRWIYNYTANGCRANEPQVDVNGDNVPDNFDYYSTGKCRNVSLNNSGLPSFDIDGDHLLDFESNMDYVPDRIVDDGTGKPLYFVGDNVQNTRLLMAVSDLGAVPSAWFSKTTELPAWWNPASGAVTGYELSLGGSYADPSGVKNAWQPAGTGLSGKVTNVALSPGRFTRLVSRIDVNSSSFTVQSTEGFAAEGIVYVGNEIMLVTKIDGTSFKINERGVQGSFKGPHTAWGEVVSDRGYVLSVRGQMADGRYIPSESGTPILIYRIDTSNPSEPGAPEPQVARGVASGQSYTLKWTAASDNESNVASYEIQEREGTSPVWATVAAIPGFKTGGAINNIYTIGDPVNPGETPRPLGKYYTYRVRSWNFAGLHSDWSPVSTPAGTTIGEELISKVTSYPNPVDLRKGGVEGRVDISYTLNDNAEVTMTIYDLLGYVVREFKFSSGSQGGQLGPNHVLWDGKNGLGGTVSKGGYIVRVKASSPKGSKVIMRKVGVIH